MNKLFVCVAAGLACAAPSMAQNISVTQNQMGAVERNNPVHVCATVDANVKNVAGYKLTFTFPMNWEVKIPDDANPTDYTTAFTLGSAAPANAQLAVNYNKTTHQLIAGLTGPSGMDGPGVVGCFDLVPTTEAAGGALTLAAEANDPLLNDVTLTATGSSLMGNACPSGANASGDLDVVDVFSPFGDAGQRLKQNQGLIAKVVVSPNSPKFAGAQFTITYDPAVLTYGPFTGSGDTAAGPALADPQLAVNSPAPGSVKVALTGSANTTTGGVLVSLPFLVKVGQTYTQTSIGLSDAKFNDAALNDVTLTLGNGIVRIDTGCAPIQGDVNADGVVNIADVVSSIRILFGLDTDPEHLKRADFDANGVMDLRDVRKLLQYIVTH